MKNIDVWQDWVILAVSGWLFFSPFVLGFATLSNPAAWVAFVCGIALFVSASEALVVPDSLEEFVNGGVGLAMIASPWLAGYSSEAVATANSVLVGLLVLGLATAALVRDLQSHVTGHHWAALR
jgi:hypothetical protein